MMRRTIFGAAVLAFLLLLGGPRRAEAQGLASLAAASTSSMTSASSMAMEKQATCWICQYLQGVGACTRGSSEGASRSGTSCRTNGGYDCEFSGSCGSASMTPLDPDGGSQSISTEGQLVVLEEGAPDVRRNCAGVIVARFQSPAAISEVRTRTGTLTL